MPGSPEPKQNRLLAALTTEERDRACPCLELVPMPPGKVDPRAESAVLQRRERAWAQALERANRELEIANSELEAFSISASHELRTPLLDIIWCLDKYATDHAGTPAGDDRRLLHLIRQGAGRMHQLIDDLLRLSTLSRQPLATATASMESIARKIAAIGRFCRRSTQCMGNDLSSI
jgi:signal transduction histidine kinase